MYRIEDNNGHVLFAENLKSRNGIYAGMDIFITLKTEQHRRHIGRVNFETKCFYIKRTTAQTYQNCYGINYHILTTANKFDTLVIFETDTNRIYKVQTNFILNEGQLLLNKTGFEKQVFITREWLEYYELKFPEGKQNAINDYEITQLTL